MGSGCTKSGGQLKHVQLAKNTAYITEDGEVFCDDDHIREIVESELYFNTALGRFWAHQVSGVTIRSM